MTTSAALILLCATGFAAPVADSAGGSSVIRFVLASSKPSGAILAEPSARRAPPDELSEVAEAVPDGPVPATPPSAVERLAVARLPVPIAVAPRGKVAGLIPLSYSLAGGARAGDAIEVDKPVTFAGADAGRIPLRIDGNARVYALGSRLAEIIARQSGEAFVPKGLERDFVSLDRLRALGIGVRYDAIRDRLMVDPPGA